MTIRMNLKDVTLVAVSGLEIEAHVKALEYSSSEIIFGRVLLLAPENPYPTRLSYDYISISGFPNVGDWGEFICFELYKYIDTDYIMLVHSDGFIVNPKSWDPSFLDYDYIGAPWPVSKIKGHFVDAAGDDVRVGNSVSLRSAKLLRAPSLLGLKWDTEEQLGYLHEDGFLCVHNKVLLESKGFKFAPLDLACRFSREEPIPENKGVNPFAFHKWKGENRQFPRFTNKERLDLVFKRALIKGIKKVVNVINGMFFR